MRLQNRRLSCSRPFVLDRFPLKAGHFNSRYCTNLTPYLSSTKRSTTLTHSRLYTKSRMADPVNHGNHGSTVSIATGSGKPSRGMPLSQNSTLEHERHFFRHDENRWAARRNGNSVRQGLLCSFRSAHACKADIEGKWISAILWNGAEPPFAELSTSSPRSWSCPPAYQPPSARAAQDRDVRTSQDPSGQGR